METLKKLFRKHSESISAAEIEKAAEKAANAVLQSYTDKIVSELRQKLESETAEIVSNALKSAREEEAEEAEKARQNAETILDAVRGTTFEKEIISAVTFEREARAELVQQIIKNRDLGFDAEDLDGLSYSHLAKIAAMATGKPVVVQAEKPKKNQKESESDYVPVTLDIFAPVHAITQTL